MRKNCEFFFRAATRRSVHRQSAGLALAMRAELQGPRAEIVVSNLRGPCRRRVDPLHTLIECCSGFVSWKSQEAVNHSRVS